MSQEEETSSDFCENFDLYKYIPPPNPLIPKNKYTDSTPKSHLSLGYVKRFIGVENEVPQGKPLNPELTNTLPNIPFFSIYEGKNVVFKRESTPNFINLNKFSKITESTQKPDEPYYKPKENDNTLVFESRFESGNLNLAVKVADFEYNLLMQNDVNTRGHTQWFYFRVTNTQVSSCKFNILNFIKKDSLFNYGMKVLVYSETENSNTGSSWFRDGESINYFANNIKRANGLKSYYTLSFTYNFRYAADTVYFAYCYPYTYRHLMEDLQKIENLSIVNRKLLCFSVAGNRCDYLTITAPGTPEEVKSRKGVVFTARVHPGETVGSFMMKGLIHFLTSSVAEAEVLRRTFVFKIVPMMNPDGVINGNYRCGLAGVDLNRRWKRPNEKLHPTVYHCKKLIKSFAREREIELVCDFHGHSRRKNVFAYGCNVPDDPSSTRLFPYTLSKLSEFFSYKFCSFKMQKSKVGTMRISLFKEIKTPMVYTIESSFCGSDKSVPHFTTKHLEKVGQDVCMALMVYRKESVVDGFLQEVKEDPGILDENCSDSSGSDSDPSDDNLDANELKGLYTEPRTKASNQSVRLSHRSDSRSKKEVSNRVLISNTILQTSNKDVRKATFVKPNGRKTVVSGVRPAQGVYFNMSGRKVKDQSTQTYRDDKGNLLIECGTDRSTSVTSEIDKNSENSFLFKQKQYLPNIVKPKKPFLSLIIGEKLKTKL